MAFRAQFPSLGMFAKRKRVVVVVTASCRRVDGSHRVCPSSAEGCSGRPPALGSAGFVRRWAAAAWFRGPPSEEPSGCFSRTAFRLCREVLVWRNRLDLGGDAPSPCLLSAPPLSWCQHTWRTAGGQLSISEARFLSLVLFCHLKMHGDNSWS